VRGFVVTPKGTVGAEAGGYAPFERMDRETAVARRLVDQAPVVGMLANLPWVKPWADVGLNAGSTYVGARGRVNDVIARSKQDDEAMSRRVGRAINPYTKPVVNALVRAGAGPTIMSALGLDPRVRRQVEGGVAELPAHVVSGLARLPENMALDTMIALDPTNDATPLQRAGAFLNVASAVLPIEELAAKGLWTAGKGVSRVGKGVGRAVRFGIAEAAAADALERGAVRACGADPEVGP
jgi:hypothetical protein